MLGHSNDNRKDRGSSGLPLSNPDQYLSIEEREYRYVPAESASRRYAPYAISKDANEFQANRMDSIPLTPLLEVRNSAFVPKDNKSNTKENVNSSKIYRQFGIRSSTLTPTLYGEEMEINDENVEEDNSFVFNRFGTNWREEQSNTTSRFAMASALIANSVTDTQTKKESELIKENRPHSYGNSAKSLFSGLHFDKMSLRDELPHAPVPGIDRKEGTSQDLGSTLTRDEENDFLTNLKIDEGAINSKEDVDYDQDEEAENASGYYVVPDRFNAAIQEFVDEDLRYPRRPRRKLLSSSTFSSTAFNYMKSPASSSCSANTTKFSVDEESSVDVEAPSRISEQGTVVVPSNNAHLLTSRNLASLCKLPIQTTFSPGPSEPTIYSSDSISSFGDGFFRENLVSNGRNGLDIESDQTVSPNERNPVNQQKITPLTCENSKPRSPRVMQLQFATSGFKFPANRSQRFCDIIDSFRSSWLASNRGDVHSTSQRSQFPSSESQNNIDLKFLLAQHRYKVEQMTHSTAKALLESEDSENHYDFVLILQSQKVYEYWSELLDFRTEILGHDIVDAMENQWAKSNHVEVGEISDGLHFPGLSISTTASSDSSSSLPNEDSTTCSNEAEDQVSQLVATPAVGVRRRRAQTADGVLLSNRIGNYNGSWSSAFSATPGSGSRHFFSSGTSRISIPSPGIYSVGTAATASTAATKGKKYHSLFERAIGTPDTSLTGRSINQQSMKTEKHYTSSLIYPRLLKDPETIKGTPNTMDCSAHNPMLYLYGSNGIVSNTLNRRRWGHQQFNDHQSKTMCSPPVWTLNNKNPDASFDLPLDRVQLLNSGQKIVNGKAPELVDNSEQCDSPLATPRNLNEIKMEDIPSQTIARGIAARTDRTNGMKPFFDALKQGIVLRRHRPGYEATFCRIFSNDNGDTIHYMPVDNEEALKSFKEQRIKYNTSSQQRSQKDVAYYSKKVTFTEELAEGQVWSLTQSPQQASEEVSRTIAADAVSEQIRKQRDDNNRIGHSVSRLASKVVSSGSAKAVDIVTVHPARHKDPRSDSGEVGTISLRKSKSDFKADWSMSLVLRGTVTASRVRGAKKKEQIDDLLNKWHERQGAENEFRYLDLEAATEGEYWLVFRGLLLLHRDALVKRFAKGRATGFGSLAEVPPEFKILHDDEFHEPKTVGCLEKAIVRFRDLDTKYMDGFVRDDARPPPSDYFLGFRSPGTAIWSRLRQAGLETRRIYSLDRKRVMLKIRCPSDRLLDVAEVLRVKLKTKEGTFAPFREDMIDMYESKFDPTEGPFSVTSDFQFRSSIRQSIIDFIVGSRIRDSGAELGQSTELGKMIEARVPLHMHKKLDDIFYAWFYFWRVDNWKGRDGRSLSHERYRYYEEISMSETLHVTYGGSDIGNAKKSDTTESYNKVPGLFTRFFVGCFYQPLDSIEQYFGEKVSFYFAWLQHTAYHLVFLSVIGLIVFSIQVASNDINHPIRPFFSVIVMLWTFIVLINWKKRENFMAYRWGTMNYKEQETTRPQFQGDYTRDAITGDWVVTYPKWKRWLKYCVSIPVTLVFTFGTMILILWVHANRDVQLAQYVQDPSAEGGEISLNFELSSIGQKSSIVDMELSSTTLTDPTFWFLVVALPSLLGLCLPLLNFILMRLSIALNDFENYRTESEYRTYLIVKVFSFRFVCYFVTLYYYAFISVGDDLAIENGILRVGTGVLVYTTVAQYWQYFIHVYFPMLIRNIRMYYRQKRLCNELNEIELDEEETAKLAINDPTTASGTISSTELRERQINIINKRLLLEQAQDKVWLEMMCPLHDSFPEYIQAVVQFTFVSCFSVVLPITPLIVLVNYLISMRLDAYKLCKGRRRPLAEKTGGIGVWEHLLQIVAVISVLTNCWLMGFTSAQSTMITEKIGEIGVFAIIVGWEHIMLLIRYILSTAISTLPKSVRDAMKKEQYILDQQRYAMMRARRHQRDYEDNHPLDLPTGSSTSSSNATANIPGSNNANNVDHNNTDNETTSTSSSIQRRSTMEELNRRDLYSRVILQANSVDEAETIAV